MAVSIATVRDEALKSQSNTPLRPIMTSLNGDNSWLLSFPRPEVERRSTGASYYHVVFEPWLAGAATVLGSWLVRLAATKAPAIATPADICKVIDQIEIHADESNEAITKRKTGAHKHEQSSIDAIFLGFHYTDHTHEPTLRLFDSRIPIIATPQVAAIVKKWAHFTTIHLISDFDRSHSSWRDSELHPRGFPAWLTALRLPGHHELNFLTVLIWSHKDSDGSGEEKHEAILQTPHGTRLDEGPLQGFLEAEPRTDKLALLHGLKESHMWGYMTTLGARGGLALFRRVGGVKYWLSTHNATLKYSGMLMRLLFLNDTPRELQWALDQEVRDGSQHAELEGGKPAVIVVENGGCFVLV